MNTVLKNPLNIQGMFLLPSSQNKMFRDRERRRVGHYLLGRYVSVTDAQAKIPFPTHSMTPLEHRKDKKKSTKKVNHMLVLKLFQEH